jgi:hypothetical protein
MDFHKLQETLYKLDPSSRSEDIARLKQSAQNKQPDDKPVKHQVTEGVKVSTDSVTDNVNDFSKLAGIPLHEAQKKGPAGQAKSKGPMPKAKPGRTKHPLDDKLVGSIEQDENDRIKKLESKVATLESVVHSIKDMVVIMSEAKGQKKINSVKADSDETKTGRDPVKKNMDTLTKPATHTDKKKAAKNGKVKHKQKTHESIKDELHFLLNKNK